MLQIDLLCVQWFKPESALFNFVEDTSISEESFSDYFEENDRSYIYPSLKKMTFLMKIYKK